MHGNAQQSRRNKFGLLRPIRVGGILRNGERKAQPQPPTPGGPPMDFSLYRIKVIRPSQKEMFREDLSSPEILRSAILARPTAIEGRASGWHVGNIEELSPTNIYFALGRTSRATVPVLSSSGDFVETEFESAPYTHVMVDVPLEVCGIAHKANLAPTTDAIARQLERVLNAAPIAAETGTSFAVSGISQPDEFLRDLWEAYAVVSFTVFFTRPNPFDVEADFLRLMERLTQETDGSAGSTTIKGTALDREPLTKLVRSAAATGDDAKARLRLREGERPVQRSLRGANARLSQERVETTDEKARFFERLRTKYHQIRGTISGDSS